jgi:hypothetical protein
MLFWEEISSKERNSMIGIMFLNRNKNIITALFGSMYGKLPCL